MAYTTEFAWVAGAFLVCLIYVWWLASDDEDRWKW
jgi:hypothetical protein